MKKLFVVMLLLTIILAGCSKQDKSAVIKLKPKVFTETAAIEKLKEWNVVQNFPEKPGTVQGIIHGGGPSPGIEVPGILETKIEKVAENTYLVTFTETWESIYFGPKDKPLLSHYEKYKVTPDKIENAGDGGDVPPQLVK